MAADLSGMLTPATLTNNPAYNSLIIKLCQLHNSKNHDYAYEKNPFSNFEEAALHTYGFTFADKRDLLKWVMITFDVLIGIKRARLRVLLSEGKTPNYESIIDTKLDLVNYEILKLAYEMQHDNNNP